MRDRQLARLALAVVLGLGGACSKAAAPGEIVATRTLPPIIPCYEADGAPCPLDAGDDAGDDASPLDAFDDSLPPATD